MAAADRNIAFIATNNDLFHHCVPLSPAHPGEEPCLLYDRNDKWFSTPLICPPTPVNIYYREIIRRENQSAGRSKEQEDVIHQQPDRVPGPAL